MVKDGKTDMPQALGELKERVFFNSWQRENLVSMIDLRRICLMKPVFLMIKFDGNGYYGSIIKVLVALARIEDKN